VVAKWAAVSVIGAVERDGWKSTMRDDLDTIMMEGDWFGGERKSTSFAMSVIHLCETEIGFSGFWAVIARLSI